MTATFEFSYMLHLRYHPDPINDPSRLQAQVDEAVKQLGERYLCHPANRIKPVWRGPCQQR